jgi:hypothetical protein
MSGARSTGLGPLARQVIGLRVLAGQAQYFAVSDAPYPPSAADCAARSFYS